MDYGSGIATLLYYAILVLFAFVALLFFALIASRMIFSRRERALDRKKAGMRQMVRRMLSEDRSPSDVKVSLDAVVPDRQRGALKQLLVEFALEPGEIGKDKVTFLYESMGFAEEDIDDLRKSRDTRKTQSAFRLGNIRSRQAVPVLLDTLHSSQNQDVIFACLSALSRIGTRQAVDGTVDYLSGDGRLENLRVAEVILRYPREFLPYVEERLQSGVDDDKQLVFLIRVAGALKDEALASAVSEYLDHPEPRVRARAAMAIGSMGFLGSCEALMETMGDGSAQVRAEAAEALGKVGCARAIGLLGDGLRDPDLEVQINSAVALTLLGRRGLGQLKEVLSSMDPRKRDDLNGVLKTERMRKGMEEQ